MTKCGTSFSKSLVSELAGQLDEELAAWRNRPLTATTYPYLSVDARYEHVRAPVRAVLADPTYRRNVERLRDEMAALPGPEYAVELLERLALEKRPLLTA